MTALHKPERATYGQAVEAQAEYRFTICSSDPKAALCWDDGDLLCCP